MACIQMLWNTPPVAEVDKLISDGRCADVRKLLQAGSLAANETLQLHFLCWSDGHTYSMTCLEYAVYHGDRNMAALLFMHGANPGKSCAY